MVWMARKMCSIPSGETFLSPPQHPDYLWGFEAIPPFIHVFSPVCCLIKYRDKFTLPHT
jgi:hypothetical protein